jgi:hypothetical protein
LSDPTYEYTAKPFNVTETGVAETEFSVIPISAKFNPSNTSNTTEGSAYYTPSSF